MASDSSLKNVHQVWGGIELVTSDSGSSQGDRIRRLKFIGSQSITLITSSDSRSSNYTSGSSSEEELARQLRKMCAKSSRTVSAVNQASAPAEEEDPPKKEDVPDPPPAPINPRLLSRGSVKHASSKCHVCHYYNSKVGCTKGASCTFCHMHGLEPRQRVCKAKRAKAKSQALALDQHFETREEFEQVVSELKAKGGYLEAVVNSKARQIRRSADEAASSSLGPSADAASSSQEVPLMRRHPAARGRLLMRRH